MAIVTGDRYLEKLVKFVEQQAGPLIEGVTVLKLNPAGLHYVQSRLEALHELESLLAGAPVDYLRAYVSDLGDHRALEQLRRILRLLTSLKVVSVLSPPTRDPTPLSLLPFGRLRVLELRGCDLSTSAARGLLELRHTLEKIICHNSTDALRHVFASRIAEIKDSPQWHRLAFVSCACNRLVLMDESLQLLPAVETLDLSRNKFAKVDSIRRCTKLKHLDLGFNHLRTISYLSEVSCHIVRLVLRNNALTTLRGIENLKSLEGLDVSFNIVSNFSELEFLAGLTSIRRLWLEGNPLCCARWYRAQVFSYFIHPDKLNLDDKEMSTREFWKSRIIVTSRQKRHASFGFYSPAKDGAGGGNINKKRKKLSRLASIESEEESTNVCSDQESTSCDIDIQSKGEIVKSDDEAEVVDLMNRLELMKKERSILWLREFKEWMDHASEDCVDGSHYNGSTLHPGTGKENFLKNKNSHRHLGESSNYILHSIQASGDGSSTNILESDNSIRDMSTSLHAHQYFDHIGALGITGGFSLPGMERMDLTQDYPISQSYEGISRLSLHGKISRPDAFTFQRGTKPVQEVTESTFTCYDEILESQSPTAVHGSPPHYQKDILHRRHYLGEEILQLSGESYSVELSDSNTSCSEDDFCEFGSLMLEDDQSLKSDYRNNSVGGHEDFFESSYYVRGHENSLTRENGRFTTSQLTSSMLKLAISDDSLEFGSNDFPSGVHDGENADFVDHAGDCVIKRKGKREQKRRIVPLLGENFKVGKMETSQRLNGNMNSCGALCEQALRKEIVGISSNQKVVDKEQNQVDTTTTSLISDASRCSVANSSLGSDDFIGNYFNKNLGDSRIGETCSRYMCCDCVLEPEVMYIDREVVLILSNQNKLYVLLGVAFEGSGTSLSLLDCHRVEDVREVLVGVGLQVVRVNMERGATYLFITRNIEKSRQLLCILQVCDSYTTNDKCSIRSLEQDQVKLFDKQICGGVKLSIFQYCMVLFWRNNNKEASGLLRSLFVIGGYLLVCTEDLRQFSSLSVDSSIPYFSLDSYCSISDVSEMVIEVRENHFVTLAFKQASSAFCPSAKVYEVKVLDEENKASCSLRWKLKWFSEESLFSFVTLLKAIHAGAAMSPLLV
ncbi:LOW QUALITY PROTEIN: LRR_4 domain-containing protein, partial [Cephalotus follicularis]